MLRKTRVGVNPPPSLSPTRCLEVGGKMENIRFACGQSQGLLLGGGCFYRWASGRKSPNCLRRAYMQDTGFYGNQKKLEEEGGTPDPKQRGVRAPSPPLVPFRSGKEGSYQPPPPPPPLPRGPCRRQRAAGLLHLLHEPRRGAAAAWPPESPPRTRTKAIRTHQIESWWFSICYALACPGSNRSLRIPSHNPTDIPTPPYTPTLNCERKSAKKPRNLRAPKDSIRSAATLSREDIGGGQSVVADC